MGTLFESPFDYYYTPITVPQIDDDPGDEYEYMVYDLEDKAGEKRRVWVNEREEKLYCPVSGDDVTSEFDFF
jgi:hypothetical protein